MALLHIPWGASFIPMWNLYHSLQLNPSSGTTTRLSAQYTLSGHPTSFRKPTSIVLHGLGFGFSLPTSCSSGFGFSSVPTLSGEKGSASISSVPHEKPLGFRNGIKPASIKTPQKKDALCRVTSKSNEKYFRVVNFFIIMTLSWFFFLDEFAAYNKEIPHQYASLPARCCNTTFPILPSPSISRT